VKNRRLALSFVVVVAIVAGVIVQALQHTAYQAETNTVVTVLGFAVAGRMVYRNIKSGQFRFPHRH
jgi:hypothetical protein